MNPERECRKPDAWSTGLILGVGVVLLGVVLLLEEIPGLGDSALLGFVKNLWPVILIVMGVARLRRPDGGHPARAWVLVILGTILLLVTLGHGHFDALIGPGLVVAAGIFIILRTLRRKRGAPVDPLPSEEYLRGTAVLSGFKRQVRSQVVKGGELTAIFGGFELDLRPAGMEGETLVLDLFLLFGGGEIRVPEEWDVSIEVTAVAGGVGDKTAALPEAGSRRPRLVLRGVILFGGVEVKR